MKFLLLASTAIAATTAPHPLHPKFRSQLNCPYAENWLSKGADAAAKELGIDIAAEHAAAARHSSTRRVLGSSLPLAGSCTYTNTWVGGQSCMNFHGDWTLEGMTEKCDLEADGVASQGVGCDDTVEDVSGWCVKDVSEGVDSMMAAPEMKEEATLLMLSAASSCDDNEMACVAFIGGRFVAAGSCAKGEDSLFASDQADMEGEEGGKCLLAPGAIGAAHQAGFSKGYSNSCPGTPAQDSPYMWPLKWSANFQTKSMGFGSDDIMFESRGRTFYALDKNWKRSDTTYQLGILRTVGQGPCENIASDSESKGFGCVLNNTDTMSTMIHKGGTMYFIDWKPDSAPIVGERDASKVEACSKINMSVVGNIRNDWYMDKRGDDTDVQYLGDQHLFYPDPEEGTIPMLVKQWRKKDFASQYFTMSMLGNPPNKLEENADAPVEDNMHWPMIINIPGQGFGDDFLQVYTKHELLTDEDDDLFMLVENFMESGGECPENTNGNGEEEEVAHGPPIQEVHIPSNLEVEEASWFSNEYTFSPIWEVPKRPVVTDMGAVSSVAAALSKPATEVSDRVTVQSCYDEATKSIDMSFHFHEIDPTSNGRLPWMAIGYRQTETCAMTPPSGGITPIILISHLEGEEAPTAHSTSLLPTAKSLSSDAFASMYMLARDLSETDDHSDVSVIAPQVTSLSKARSSLTTDDTVTLNFKRTVGEKPEQLNLMYAIGMSSDLGIHTTRKCFVIDTFPSCSSTNGQVLSESDTMMEMDNAEIKFSLGVSAASTIMMSTFATIAISCAIGAVTLF